MDLSSTFDMYDGMVTTRLFATSRFADRGYLLFFLRGSSVIIIIFPI